MRQSNFSRRIFINKDINTVFDAWARQGGMESWFLKKASFTRGDTKLEIGEKVRTGDHYDWIWHTWPDNIQSGVVTSCIPAREFSFSFDPGGNVTVTFESLDQNRTVVILKQYDINTDEESWYNYFHGCSLGWSFWLVNLKAYLEHGIVLDQRDIIYSDERHLQIVNQ